MVSEQAEDRYIAALDAFDAGDYHCARALLAPLRLRPPGDEVRDETDGLLRRMDPDPRQGMWVPLGALALLSVVIWTVL